VHSGTADGRLTDAAEAFWNTVQKGKREAPSPGDAAK
jgi:hypothetical protein